MPRIDALVVLRTSADIAEVRGILDATEIVEQYAKLPPTAFDLLSVAKNKIFGTPSLRSFARANKHATILGVELDRSVTNRVQQLTAAVGSTATVKGYTDLRGADYDIEIFMAVNACQQDIDAIRVTIERDADVDSYRFISKEEALAEFRQLFRDEPDLIRNTTASSLPTSFRLHLRDRVMPSAVANRYEHLAGTRFVNAPANPFADPSSFAPENNAQSTCPATP